MKETFEFQDSNTTALPYHTLTHTHTRKGAHVQRHDSAHTLTHLWYCSSLMTCLLTRQMYVWVIKKRVSPLCTCTHNPLCYVCMCIELPSELMTEKHKETHKFIQSLTETVKFFFKFTFLIKTLVRFLTARYQIRGKLDVGQLWAYMCFPQSRDIAQMILSLTDKECETKGLKMAILSNCFCDDRVVLQIKYDADIEYILDCKGVKTLCKALIAWFTQIAKKKSHCGLYL